MVQFVKFSRVSDIESAVTYVNPAMVEMVVGDSTVDDKCIIAFTGDEDASLTVNESIDNVIAKLQGKFSE